MKKILTIAIAVMMIAVMSVSVFAADSGKIYVIDLESGTDYADLGNMGYQSGKGVEADNNGGVLGLGPKDNGDGTFSDAFISFPVEVETAGEYDIIVRYAAKAKDGQNRCFVISVNGKEIKTFENLNTGDWGVYALATISANLKAGENTVTLTNVEEFDDEVYKSVNILYLEWTLKGAGSGNEDTEETEPEETEPEETDPVETEPEETEPEETDPEETDPVETEPEETDPVTDAPEEDPAVTTAPTPDDTPAEEKSGCGSAMGAFAVVLALVSTLGTALIRRK